MLLAGFDLDSSHLASEAIDYGNPTIAARDVVDRETLKAFVTGAGEYFIGLFETGDSAVTSKARIALRDPNGPWRHGSVYLYVLDLDSNSILVHGANPDRYELRPLVATVRDVVTGKLVLEEVIKAAKSSPEGGFVEYYFDDPTDDTDSADIPKVGYARQFTGEGTRPDGSAISRNFIYEEWGVSGLVRLDPGASGRGLSLSVQPAWGRTAGGVQRLWETGDILGASPADQASARMSAEIGYGLGAPRGLGVVTPYAGLGLAGEGARSGRVGARWRVAPEASLSLEGTRREKDLHGSGLTAVRRAFTLPA